MPKAANTRRMGRNVVAKNLMGDIKFQQTPQKPQKPPGTAAHQRNEGFRGNEPKGQVGKTGHPSSLLCLHHASKFPQPVSTTYTMTWRYLRFLRSFP
jgi:hypothetical protein